MEKQRTNESILNVVLESNDGVLLDRKKNILGSVKNSAGKEKLSRTIDNRKGRLDV